MSAVTKTYPPRLAYSALERRAMLVTVAVLPAHAGVGGGAR